MQRIRSHISFFVCFFLFPIISFSLESAKASIDTVAAMKNANKEMKRTLRKDLDIDDIDDLADDMAELMDDFNEINEALGRNYATPDDIDETDLDAELEMLGDELEEEMLADDAGAEATATPSYLMPTMPAGDLATPTLQQPAQEVDEYGLPTNPIGNS
jgi:charged multivesicular body protein 5